MAWYENPTVAAILGGLFGAVLTSIASIFIWKKTNKIRRIDGIINDTSALLSFSEKIKDKLEIKYSGENAEAVYLFSIDIINSGTEAVRDQPVGIRVDKSAQIVDYTFKTEPEIGFGDILEINKNGNALDLQIGLLNPKDCVSIELVSLDNNKEDLNIYLKNENVQSRVYTRKSAEQQLVGALSDREMVLLAFTSSIPFLGGIAKSMMTVSLAQRIDNISKKQ